MPKAAKKQVVRGAVSREVFGQGRTETRAGLYARVSTHDQQTLPTQLAAMRQYARKRGWTVAIEVQEVASGAKDRPEPQRIIDAAERRCVDRIVFWRLHRLGRSVADLGTALHDLPTGDVGFISLNEALDLT